MRAEFETLATLAVPDRVEWTTKLARSHVEHYRTVFSYVATLAQSRGVKDALDVGAVPGFITVTLKANGLNVEAVDIDPGRAQGIFDSVGVPCHQVDIERETLPFDSESFDVVLFNEVIEHLRINPFFPLREIHRVLRHDGLILLSTPNITLPMRLRFVYGTEFQGDIIREFKKLETVGHMGHFRLYSKSEVERLMAQLGFEVKSVRARTVTGSRQSWRKRLLERLVPNQVGGHLYILAQKVKPAHR